jgi:predicted transposase YdaD
MDTDGPLKLLFRKYPQDLLPLTGDSGALVRRAGPVELHALKRRVDCVLELERDGEAYYRHIEFQAEPDPDMPTRIFRYNTQLLLEYSAPVLSTVVYLLPPRPKTSAVFRVRLGGREVNRWSFEQICLWDLDARESLTRAAPGLVALVPLMRGGTEWPVLEEAVHQIESAFPQPGLSDAEDVLLALAGRYYTVSELSRIVGRDRMFHQSSLYTEGRAEGHAEGHAEGRVEGEALGRLEAERDLCVALAFKHHASVIERARPRIETCDDPARLKEWALASSDLSDDEFLRLIGA